ncbi:MAG: M42 family metallopeptidase [Clostridiales bacterium]|nr:M42 family metallopeptidase [Clostridiales bacterium]
MNTFETLSRLTQTHGVSGNEGNIRSLICSLAKPYADDIREDAMGNLIVHRAGKGPKLLFSAHMDSVGLVATHIDKDGTIRFGTLGGFCVPDLIQQTFRFQNGTYALCCAREDKLEEAKLRDLYLDIGAANEREAKELVQVGDTAAFVSPLKHLSKNRVSGCFLDNRIGCLALLKALKDVTSPANDLYFVFSVQEEVGTRGAKPASFGVDPDYGIAVDVTCADDVPGSLHEGTAVMGKGAAVKVMDHSVICSPSLVKRLNDLAATKGIPVQPDILTCGGTDAGPIRTTRKGVVTGGISVPCRYTHSAVEQCDLEDLEACIRLIRAVCEEALPTV